MGLCTLIACKPTVPSQYVQPDDMVDLLCDYHIAQSMADHNSADGKEREFNEHLYTAAVLQKYGVTKAEFDSSLTYYYVRADRFSEIYKEVAERLSEKAMEYGASEGEVNRFANLTANGDTTDVWAGKLSTILMPYAPYNIFSFEQKADTTFRNGDAFMFIIYSDFVYQNGMRNAEACLSVRYDNDSVVSRVTGISSSGINQIRIPANGNHIVKDIRGYIYVTLEKEPTTTLKLMLIRNLQLIKFRKKEQKATEAADSTDQKKNLIQLN